MPSVTDDTISPNSELRPLADESYLKKASIGVRDNVMCPEIPIIRAGPSKPPPPPPPPPPLLLFRPCVNYRYRVSAPPITPTIRMITTNETASQNTYNNDKIIATIADNDNINNYIDKNNTTGMDSEHSESDECEKINQKNKVNNNKSGTVNGSSKIAAKLNKRENYPSRLANLRPGSFYYMLEKFGCETYVLSIKIDDKIYIGTGVGKTNAKRNAAFIALQSITSNKVVKCSPIDLLSQRKPKSKIIYGFESLKEGADSYYMYSVKIDNDCYFGDGDTAQTAKNRAAEAALLYIDNKLHEYFTKTDYEANYFKCLYELNSIKYGEILCKIEHNVVNNSSNSKITKLSTVKNNCIDSNGKHDKNSINNNEIKTSISTNNNVNDNRLSTIRNSMEALKKLRPGAFYYMESKLREPERYVMCIKIDGVIYKGVGSNKSKACQIAAHNALENIKDKRVISHDPIKNLYSLMSEKNVKHKLKFQSNSKHAPVYTYGVKVNGIEYIGEADSKEASKFAAFERAYESLSAAKLYVKLSNGKNNKSINNVVTASTSAVTVTENSTNNTKLITSSPKESGNSGVPPMFPSSVNSITTTNEDHVPVTTSLTISPISSISNTLHTSSSTTTTTNNAMVSDKSDNNKIMYKFPMTKLQELRPGSYYYMESKHGAEFALIFTMCIKIDGVIYKGEGLGKERAKGAAAQAALNGMKDTTKIVVCETPLSELGKLRTGLIPVLKSKSGSLHDPQFVFMVEVDGKEFLGNGDTVMTAKYKAAENALEYLRTVHTVVNADNNKDVPVEFIYSDKLNSVTSPPVDTTLKVSDFKIEGIGTNERSCFCVLRSIQPDLEYYITNNDDRFQVTIKINNKTFTADSKWKIIAQLSAAKKSLIALDSIKKFYSEFLLIRHKIQSNLKFQRNNGSRKYPIMVYTVEYDQRKYVGMDSSQILAKDQVTEAAYLDYVFNQRNNCSSVSISTLSRSGSSISINNNNNQRNQMNTPATFNLSNEIKISISTIPKTTMDVLRKKFPAVKANYEYETGTPGQPIFTMSVTVNDIRYIGRGSSKIRANYKAAEAALRDLNELKSGIIGQYKNSWEMLKALFELKCKIMHETESAGTPVITMSVTFQNGEYYGIGGTVEEAIIQASEAAVGELNPSTIIAAKESMDVTMRQKKDIGSVSISSNQNAHRNCIDILKMSHRDAMYEAESNIPTTDGALFKIRVQFNEITKFYGYGMSEHTAKLNAAEVALRSLNKIANPLMLLKEKHSNLTIEKPTVTSKFFRVNIHYHDNYFTGMGKTAEEAMDQAAEAAIGFEILKGNKICPLCTDFKSLKVKPIDSNINGITFKDIPIRPMSIGNGCKADLLVQNELSSEICFSKDVNLTGLQSEIDKIQSSLNRISQIGDTILNNKNDINCELIKAKESLDNLSVICSTVLRKINLANQYLKGLNMNPIDLFNKIFPTVYIRYETIKTSKHISDIKAITRINGQSFEARGSSSKLANVAIAKTVLAALFSISFNSFSSGISASASSSSLSSIPSIMQTSSSYNHLKLNQAFADTVQKLILDKFDALRQTLSTRYCGRKVFAGIVMSENYNINTAQVICVTSGTKFIAGEHISLHGKVINDSHAEIVTRRCLLEYFYTQLELVQEWGHASIFVKSDKSGVKYSLKPNIKFHLYISTSPCGDASYNTRNVKVAGKLRCKLEAGEGTFITDDCCAQSWDGILQGQRLRVMSCSDKILKWNVVGLQGALLSALIEPIYLDSIILGRNYTFCTPRALSERVGSMIPNLSEPYRVNSPKYSTVSSVQPRDVNLQSNFCLNWIIHNRNVEIINTVNGQIVDGRHGFVGQMSRLSKYEFYHRFVNLLIKLDSKISFTNYYEAKLIALHYQEAKSNFYATLKRKNLGSWMRKPIEQDIGVI